MSFTPIEWKYNPPKTLAPAPPMPAVATPSAETSRAAALIARVRDLREASVYLQGLILERSKNIGILVDPQDTDLVLALERLYGELPPGVSVDMYNYLLDAQAGIARTEVALAETGSSNQIDAVQKADLQLITDRFESALIEEGSFPSALPLLLPQLKNDAMIFDHLESGLGEYPVLQGFQSGDRSSTTDVPVDVFDPEVGTADLGYQADSRLSGYDHVAWRKDDNPNRQIVQQIVRQINDSIVTETVSDPAIPKIDISPDAASNLSDRLGLWERYYYGAYDIAAQVDQLTSDIHEWANQYLYQPLRDLAYVLTLVRMLKTFFSKPTLKKLKGSLAAFVLPRLISEFSIFHFALDRAVQIAVGPAENLVRSFGRLFGEIQSNASYISWLLRPQVFQANGQTTTANGFTGLVRSSISGNMVMPPQKDLEKLDTVGRGLAKIGSTISWATREVFRQRDYVENSLYKTLDSKLNEDGDRLEVLDALRSFDALINVTSKYLQMSGGPSASSPIEGGLGQLDRLIAEATTDAVPTLNPPPAVQRVFDNGAATIQGTSHA